jgi:hypothetical protein
MTKPWINTMALNLIDKIYGETLVKFSDQI